MVNQRYLDPMMVRNNASTLAALTGPTNIPSSQLSTPDYLHHLRELAAADPRCQEGLQKVEWLILKNRRDIGRIRGGSLMYQSIDGD